MNEECKICDNYLQKYRAERFQPFRVEYECPISELSEM